MRARSPLTPALSPQGGGDRKRLYLPPQLQWALLAIAMLPSALYGRAVISADGCVLSFAMVVAALCLAGARGVQRPWERALWMTLCTLSKLPQAALVLLEAMTAPPKDLVRRWRTLLLVIAPGF